MDAINAVVQKKFLTRGFKSLKRGLIFNEAGQKMVVQEYHGAFSIKVVRSVMWILQNIKVSREVIMNVVFDVKLV